jgi:hypothetical protein
MLRNGKVFCNLCNLECNRFHKIIKIKREPIDSEHPDDEFVHLHDRDSGDCWTRVRKAAQVRSQAKRPTAQDFSDFQKLQIQQQAKRMAGNAR